MSAAICFKYNKINRYHEQMIQTMIQSYHLTKSI